MKKYIILFLLIGFLGLFSNSCSDDFLDKTPQSGIAEEDVFSKYENLTKYFRSVYEGSWNIKLAFPLQATMLQYKGSWDLFTELDDNGSPQSYLNIKMGIFSSGDQDQWSNSSTMGNQQHMFRVIRICNITLKNINRLQDATPEDKDDLIAQAHFVRAYAHFWLFKIWGRQPYITHIIGANDPWDLPRLTKHETLMQIAADMDTAYTFYEKAGKIRRDNPTPGAPGNLNHPDLKYPNGVAAKAIKGRVLLFAASPLNNNLGVTDWQNAAKANWEALKLAEQWGYSLVNTADYKKNFNGVAQTNEHLWAWPQGNLNATALYSIIPRSIAGSNTENYGDSPTQNAVDKFETKWGDPLNTPDERNAAIALGHYYDQDPYANRDPRFYIDIIYNTAPMIGFGAAKIYYEIIGGVPKYSQLLDQSQVDATKTGYYNRKQWGDQSSLNPISVPYPDPIIRLAELYLNYAEAANEAYGPNTPAPGATLSALQAVNIIRNRVGQPDVLPVFTESKEVFRSRIKNERTVEFLCEAQYFFDVRRWMDAPVTCSTVMMGMDIEKVPVSATYPTGYKYTRVSLPSGHQIKWLPNMYYFPHSLSDAYKMKIYESNPQW